MLREITQTLFKKISLRILNKLSSAEHNPYHNSFSSNELEFYCNSGVRGTSLLCCCWSSDILCYITFKNNKQENSINININIAMILYFILIDISKKLYYRHLPRTSIIDRTIKRTHRMDFKELFKVKQNK